MQIKAHMPTEEPARQANFNTLRVHSERLAALTRFEYASVVVPPADEDAWEGTEIDVLRTVL
ncbi:hypothetical protein [Pelomonas sp. Root1444]|uniref:hypothetical protein n=1 Tax=Pelomonas sp. Root1444 TaxID=1736464 RepID=UPI0007024957|nr:hypothetical protein [Pelomonas sp. Root1444]KQY88272.1 hypothetical protein ASD35_11825 [Pelomonas sp. Root1444]